MLLIFLSSCLAVVVQSERNCFTPTEAMHAGHLLRYHFKAVGDRLKTLNIDHSSRTLHSFLQNLTELSGTKQLFGEGKLDRIMKISHIKVFLEDMFRQFDDEFNKTIDTLTLFGSKSHILDIQTLTTSIKQVVQNLEYTQNSVITKHVEKRLPKGKRMIMEFMQILAVFMESYGRKRSVDPNLMKEDDPDQEQQMSKEKRAWFQQILELVAISLDAWNGRGRRSVTPNLMKEDDPDQEQQMSKEKRAWLQQILELVAISLDAWNGRGRRSIEVARSLGYTVAKTASLLPNCTSMKSRMSTPNLPIAVLRALHDA